MADAALIFSILGRDKFSDVLAKIKGEAATANNENLKGLKAIETQLEKTRTAAKKLAEDFARTGDDDIRRDWQRAERQITQLERLREQLTKAIGGDGKSGSDSGGIFGNLRNFDLDKFLVNSVKSAGKGINAAWDGIWKSMTNNPVVSTAIIGAIGVGLPMITATIGGAIASGVGLGLGGGVIALGISRAVNDGQVSAAWGHLADTAAASMDRSSGRFVAPLIRAAHKFEDAWNADVAPGIDSAMDALAPKLDDLTDSAVKFARNIGPGFDDAVAAAGPFIDILSERLPDIGDAISSFLGHLNNAGPGAEMFFDDLLTLTEQTIRALGWLVEKGSATYEVFSGLGFMLQGDFKRGMEVGRDGFKHLISGADSGEASFGGFHNKTINVNTALGLLDGSMHKASDGTIAAGPNFAALSKVLGQTEVSADTLAGKMTDRLMGTMLGLSHSTLDVNSAQLTLKDTLTNNGLAIDQHTGLVSMNTRAGISNREAVLAGIESNLRHYDAQIASGVGADVAAQKYGANTEALRATMRQAHLTEGQIDDLIGEYGKVPGKVNTAIAMQGLTDAINGLSDLLRQINGIDGKTANTYTIHHITTEEMVRRIDAGNQLPGGHRVQRWGGVWQHAAVGTLRDAQVYSAVSSGARYAFAEPSTGGEAFVPKFGNRARSMGILQHAASWYDAAVVPAYVASSAAGAASTSAGATYVDSRQVTYVINDATDPQRVVAAIKRYEQDNGPAPIGRR